MKGKDGGSEAEALDGTNDEVQSRRIHQVEPRNVHPLVEIVQCATSNAQQQGMAQRGVLDADGACD